VSEINLDYINNITSQLNNINDFVDENMAGLENASEAEIEAKVLKIKTYLEEKLSVIRLNIIEFLKKQYSSILAQLTPLEPLISPPTSINAVITWASSVADYFKGPYIKMIQLQTEILTAVVNLSTALIATANHSFSNPNIPTISIDVEPITPSDIIA